MSEAIKNRRTVIPTEILMRAICQEWTRRADWVW